MSAKSKTPAEALYSYVLNPATNAPHNGALSRISEWCGVSVQSVKRWFSGEPMSAESASLAWQFIRGRKSFSRLQRTKRKGVMVKRGATVKK